MGLWEIAVLSLLRERPMHPYEIQKVLKERHKDAILVLKRGSLYHAIGRLEAAQLIKAGSTSRNGLRPERTTYRILAAGKAALVEWLRKFIALPQNERSHFMGSLSFLVHLTPEDAIIDMAGRAERLKEEIASLDGLLAEAQSRLPRIHLIESEYARAMRAAELSWVRSTLRELESGALRWDIDEILSEIRPRDSKTRSGRRP
ncbi:MAG TPA: PadR family transcriptional regulator [Bryobacteraceae bacterium]|nr:PadR family transcriptional regulator [Bryobacteraceae bacterium]